MKKLRYLILALLLIPAAAWATSAYIIGIAGIVAEPGVSLLFYSNADSNTSGQSPQIGSGTITIGANVAVVSGVVDNALHVNGGWDSGKITIPSANISTAVGTLGFYLKRNAAGSYLPLLWIGTASAADELFKLEESATDNVHWFYAATGQLIDFDLDEARFIELSWDYSNSKMSYRVNGGSWTEISITGTQPPTDNLIFGGFNGTNLNFWVDQIFISEDYQADLYSIRTETSP